MSHDVVGVTYGPFGYAEPAEPNATRRWRPPSALAAVTRPVAPEPALPVPERVPPGRLLSLTPRQRQILARIALGHHGKKIARDLGLTEKGVDTHKYRIMNRLGVRDRVLLTHAAIRFGLVELKGPAEGTMPEPCPSPPPTILPRHWPPPGSSGRTSSGSTRPGRVPR